MWFVINFIALECFLPFISWFWLRTVTRIMFEFKTEEMGGEGWIMCSFIICTACHILGYQTTVAKWVRNLACMGVTVIVNRFLIGKREGKSPLRRPCEHGRMILK